VKTKIQEKISRFDPKTAMNLKMSAYNKKKNKEKF